MAFQTKKTTKLATDGVFNFWTEFRTFAFKGNVIDLAVGIIIGASFNTVVQSLVNDMIMPIFGKILGDVAFSSLYINLSGVEYDSLADAILAGAPVIKYGLFITNVINFVIVALSLFIILKFIFRKKMEAEEKGEV